MDLPINRFKQAIREGGTHFGAWLSSGAPSTAEAMGCVGFDFVVIDMEHTPIDTPQLVELLRAASATPTPAIVRLPWNDMVTIKRALDAGAQTLMMPFVQNEEEARRAISYTRYPPEGVRGVAGSHRASRYSTVSNYLQNASTQICVIVQIETVAAVEQLPQIAALPGIDSIFIGPSDLAASMGLLGDVGSALVQDQLKSCARICRQLAKPCGIIGGNAEAVARFAGYGYDWIAIGSDVTFMIARAQESLGKARALPRRATQ